MLVKRDCWVHVLVLICAIGLQNVNTLLFRKADRFSSPTSTLTVQNSLDNADIDHLNRRSQDVTPRIAVDSL